MANYNTPGTALWAFTRLRGDVLDNMLDDILDLETTGIEEEKCSEIRKALGSLTNQATKFPDNSGVIIRTSIFSRLQVIEEEYIKWNDIRGTSENELIRRRNQLRTIRKSRQLLAQTARKSQYILSNDLDLEQVQALYKALRELTTAIPNTLTRLSNTLDKIVRIMPSLDSRSE